MKLVFETQQNVFLKDITQLCIFNKKKISIQLCIIELIIFCKLCVIIKMIYTISITNYK